MVCSLRYRQHRYVNLKQHTEACVILVCLMAHFHFSRRPWLNIPQHKATTWMLMRYSNTGSLLADTAHVSGEPVSGQRHARWSHKKRTFCSIVIITFVKLVLPFVTKQTATENGAFHVPIHSELIFLLWVSALLYSFTELIFFFCSLIQPGIHSPVQSFVY
jgi:hypothetical protein